MKRGLVLALLALPALASSCAISSAVSTFWTYVGVYGTMLLVLYLITTYALGYLGSLVPASLASAIQAVFLYAAGGLVVLGLILATLTFVTAKLLGG